MTVAAIVQCTSADLVSSRDPLDYCIQKCLDAELIDKVVIACPVGSDNAELKAAASSWGVEFFEGSEMNVSDRLLGAADFVGASVVVRVLLRQFYLDLEQVSRMINVLKSSNADYVVLPPDYNYALAADVGTTDALRRAVHKISAIEDERTRSSHQFSPWIYVEERPEEFSLVDIDGGPAYPSSKTEDIRAKYALLVSENQTHFKWNYPASSYGFLGQYLNKTDVVLDIACGKGQGVRRLKEYCIEAVGVDLTPEHVEIANRELGDVDGISYEFGNAETYLKPGYFDAVVSLHTLEHLEKPDDFMVCSRKNLKYGGKLLLEVPLLLPHPLGRPLMPWHHKEFDFQELVDLVLKHGFEIEEVWAKKRHAFVEMGFDGKGIALQEGRLTAGIIIATKV